MESFQPTEQNKSRETEPLRFEAGIISQAEKDAIYSAIDKKVCPPWNTALGGAIMIHGNYQKGIPTAGCVAVSDNVMDILWPYGQLGIKVSVGP